MGQYRQVTVGQAGFGWFLTTLLWVTQFIQSCSCTQSLGSTRCWWHFISIPDVCDLCCVSDDELLKCLGLGQPWSIVDVTNGLEEATVLFGMVIHPFIFYFLKKDLFIWKAKREWVKERMNKMYESCIFGYSPYGCDSWGWTKLKPEARDSVFPKRWQGPMTWVIFCCFPWYIRREMEW